MPNANLSNTRLINLSYNPTLRVDSQFGVGYGDDITQVKEILLDVVDAHVLIFDEPAPAVTLGELGDSAVAFNLRVWTTREDYWNIYFDVMEIVKRHFTRRESTFPTPRWTCIWTSSKQHTHRFHARVDSRLEVHPGDGSALQYWIYVPMFPPGLQGP